MKKNDFLLVFGILLVSLFLFLFQKFSDKGAQVLVTVDGERYGTYSLLDDQTIDINGTNLLVIEGGSAHIDRADCPDQICVRHKHISKSGESIICLPNKLVVTIQNGDVPEIDGITR